MTSINNTTTTLYLQANGRTVEIDWRYKKYLDIWRYYDKDVSGTMDASEIKSMKDDIKNAAGADGKLGIDDLKKFSAKFSRTDSDVLQFFHEIDGDLIGAELRDKLNPGFFGKKDLAGAKKLISRINKKNIMKVNYLYKDYNQDKDGSLVKDISESYPASEAFTMLKFLAQKAIAACKDKNINIKSIAAEYQKAEQAGDKDAMAQVIDSILDALDHKEVSSIQIHVSRKKMQEADEPIELTADSKADLKAMAESKGINPASKDLLGDGIIGNSRSVAMSKKGQKILNALNTLLQDETMKEKINSCLKKENDCICFYIPSTDTTYPYSENGLVRGYDIFLNDRYVIKETSIGDGDMSLLISSIMVEAERKFKNINWMSEEDISDFIKDLFELEETPSLFERFKKTVTSIF